MRLTKRSYDPEILDQDPTAYSKEEYEDCLYQLSRVGYLLGGNKATLQTLSRFPKPNSIIDVGCGGGQFTIELAKQFPEAQVLGVDISSQAIEFSQSQLEVSHLKNLKFSVSPSPELNYPANSFDVVTATLVCHHMKDEELISFLKQSYQVANKIIIINDLHRHWLPYAGFALIAKPLFNNRIITHDGLLSIQRAFKKKDWLEYLEAAQIPLKQCTISWHWAFRWVVCINTSSK